MECCKIRQEVIAAIFRVPKAKGQYRLDYSRTTFANPNRMHRSLNLRLLYWIRDHKNSFVLADLVRYFATKL
jgi:hypothetical protein